MEKCLVKMGRWYMILLVSEFMNGSVYTSFEELFMSLGRHQETM